MDGRVSDASAWLEDRIRGAPPQLVARVEQCVAVMPGVELGSRLAHVGEQALGAAIRQGARRGAALDLLAADALITLCLLECAERDPSSLGETARRLREAAAVS
jgi:hypothetical protein